MASFILWDFRPLDSQAQIDKMIKYIITNKINLTDKQKEDIVQFTNIRFKISCKSQLANLPRFAVATDFEDEAMVGVGANTGARVDAESVKVIAHKPETIEDIASSIAERCENEYMQHVMLPAVARIHGSVRSNNHFYPDYMGEIWLTNGENLDGRSALTGGKHGRAVYKNSRMGEYLIKYHNGQHQYSFISNLPRRRVTITLDIFNQSRFDSMGRSADDITVYLENHDEPLVFNNLNELIMTQKYLQKKAEEQRKLIEEKKRQEIEQQRRAEEERKRAEEIRRQAEAEAKRLAEIARQAEEARKRMEEERKAEEAARLREELERKEAERIRAEEEAKRKEEERLRAEEEARRQEEEARRQEEARREAEEEEKQMLRDIEELERRKQQGIAMVKQHQGVIRKDFALRSQHILDPSQEDAKRSHIFDNVPIVIEGGPGTGKTTTMIQRLKFLLSAEALNEYDSPLNVQQIKELTDPRTVDHNWIFFSPTQQLLSFLRQNMRRENLHANQDNTATLSTFDKRIMLDYKLKNTFRYKTENEQTSIFVNPEEAILEFEIFSVQYIVNVLKKSASLNTASFSWHPLALKIKSILASTDRMTLDTPSLISIIGQLNDLQPEATDLLQSLKDETNKVGFPILRNIMKDNDLVDEINNMLDEWEDEGSENAVDVASDEMQDEAEEEMSIRVDIEAKLSMYVNAIVKALALRSIDPEIKMSERQSELFDLTKDKFSDINLNELAGLAWFERKFAILLKGVKVNLLEQYPKIYKDFKKKCAENPEQTIYNPTLLKKYKGTAMHPDELHLLVGFINRQIVLLKRIMGIRLEESRSHKFIDAFDSHAKHVIGIDEATDYSWLDYYFIASFAHPEYNTITLCGDIMQGLNGNGIKSWKTDLASIFPKLEVRPLKVSYRQSPTLVSMSRKMYKDDQGKDAPFKSKKTKSESEPAPLAFVSDDEGKKARWIAKKIEEVYKAYNEQMPSVAIFVGAKEEIPMLIDLLSEDEHLNSIEVVNCSDNRVSQTDKCVRVFDIREVKGMEFEVAFFHNIDMALDGSTTELMRRYLYVGISRASNYLAATFTQEEDNEEILKYFKRSGRKDWKI